jgi:hypothetical protein
MPEIVQARPSRRRGGRRWRIRGVHQPDHRRDEVGKGRGLPGGEQVRQRQQRERPGRDKRPEAQPGVVASRRAGVPVRLAIGRADPAGLDDAMFVEAGTERDAEVDDEEPD